MPAVGNGNGTGVGKGPGVGRGGHRVLGGGSWVVWDLLNHVNRINKSK